MSCKHEEAFWFDGDKRDGYWCPDCNQWVGETCQTCGGQGFVQEDEYEGDWINCGPDLITCPECRGDGKVWYEDDEP